MLRKCWIRKKKEKCEKWNFMFGVAKAESCFLRIPFTSIFLPFLHDPKFLRLCIPYRIHSNCTTNNFPDVVSRKSEFKFRISCLNTHYFQLLGAFSVFSVFWWYVKYFKTTREPVCALLCSLKILFSPWVKNNFLPPFDEYFSQTSCIRCAWKYKVDV